MSKVEFLLDPSNKRYKIFPILYDDLYQFYIKHRSLFWIPEEVVLSKDISDWKNKLNDDERNFIKMILVFFAISDFIVNENLSIDQDQITILEYKLFIDNKIDRENIHSLMYARLISTFIEDDGGLLDSVQDIPTIKAKIEWFRKYYDKSFSHRIVSCAITEGIFFSGSFCSIDWLKSRNLMPGLCNSNEFISREEGMHHDVACYVYKKYVVNKLKEDEIIEMIKEAVDIECNFIKYVLPNNLNGINNEVMSQYIKFVADRLSIELIDHKIYNLPLPFEWMNSRSQYRKTNFFEHRVTEYNKYKPEEKIKRLNDY